MEFPLRRLLFIAVVVALVVVGVLFGSINQQIADLHLLVISVQWRVVDIALVFMLLGILIGFFIASLFSLQRKAKGWLRKPAEPR